MAVILLQDDSARQADHRQEDDQFSEDDRQWQRHRLSVWIQRRYELVLLLPDNQHYSRRDPKKATRLLLSYPPDYISTEI